MYRAVFAFFAATIVSGCASGGAHPTAIASVAPAVHHAPEPAWHKAMVPGDEDRLADLNVSWAKLHAALRAPVRTAQGELLDPAAGLANAELPPGSYRCRSLRLRAGTRGAATVMPTAPGFCFVSGATDSLGFAKQTGADIAAGYFYPDGKRYVFLGARQRKPGDNSIGHGADPTRDLVGVAERYGNFHWRLAVTGARAGDIDVYDLTPVPAEQQPRARS